MAAVRKFEIVPEKPLSEAEVGNWQVCDTVDGVHDGLMIVAVEVLVIVALGVPSMVEDEVDPMAVGVGVTLPDGTNSGQLQENGIGRVAMSNGSWKDARTARFADINETIAPFRRNAHEVPPDRSFRIHTEQDVTSGNSAPRSTSHQFPQPLAVAA